MARQGRVLAALQGALAVGLGQSSGTACIMKKTSSRGSVLWRQNQAVLSSGFALAFALLAEPVLAGCTSPYQTVFACDLHGGSKRVEVCATHEEYYTSKMTYEFGTPGETPELAFTSVKEYGTAKYEDWGIGLMHQSGAVYTVYAKGSYDDGSIDRGILEVFNSVDDFNARIPAVFHAECREETIEGDFRFFFP
jgi:hypothetical protein